MRAFVGCVLLGLAVLLFGLEIVALVDPVGTKMADDADPFGPPPPWYSHVVGFAVIALLVALAAKVYPPRAPRKAGTAKSQIGERAAELPTATDERDV